MDHSGRSLPAAGFDEYERILGLVEQRRFDEALVRGQVLLEQPETAALIKAKTHNLLSWLLLEGLRRPVPAALLHAEEAIRIACRLGEREIELQALLNLAAAAYQHGDYEAAEGTYRRAEALLESAPAPLPAVRTLILQGLSDVAAARGDLEQALQLLDRAEAALGSEGSQVLLAELFRRRAILLLRMGRPKEAGRELGKAEQPLPLGERPGLWWRSQLAVARAALELALGRKVKARRQAETALALAQELGDTPALAEAHSLLALLETSACREKAHARARLALSYAIQSGRRDVVEGVRRRVGAFLEADT